MNILENNEEIIIRRAEREDMHATSKIAVAGWQTAYRGIIDDDFLNNLNADEIYNKRLADFDKYKIIVAECNNEILGFCRYRIGDFYKGIIENSDCEIVALYVKPDCKRNGIGKKLVNYTINDLKGNGCFNMIIWCLKDNYPSRFFYERVGGIFCGEKPINFGNKDYMEAGYLYNLSKLPVDDLELVNPSNEYKKQIEEYLQEFINNGERELAGDAGLDRIKDVDEWLKKVKADKEIQKSEKDKVAASEYLTIRKSDKKIVGNIQIRQYLNEKLLQFGGHIGDSVRPSERKKGYGTEQIRLALIKCKDYNIRNVLMTCSKENIASAKTIQKNDGVLENEFILNDSVEQRYWISLKKRFVTVPQNMKNVKQGSVTIRNFTDSVFKGDIAFVQFKEMSEPFILPDINLCIADNNYKWLEFYDYRKKYCLTAMYNDKNEIIEWYFDISREIGKKNGVPYEDDLYLDVVVQPDGNILLLDEDELKDAYDRLEITETEYINAKKVANDLINTLSGKMDDLKEFTDKYLYIMSKGDK